MATAPACLAQSRILPTDLAPQQNLGLVASASFRTLDQSFLRLVNKLMHSL
jgi:hypothetical protein